ncbi:MAG: Rieske (2Fe-2S) protein [Myxococcota bacterium]
MGIRSFIKRKVDQKLGSSTPTPAAVEKDNRPLPLGKDAEGFIAVLRETDLAVGKGRTVAVSNTPVAVFHLQSGFFAIDDACTHEDAPLGEGEIKNGRVLCPYHDWVFNITTGECETDPSRPVGCFATKVHDGFVWVGARTTEGTHLRGGDHADGLNTSEHAS